MRDLFDASEVRKALLRFIPAGSVFEVRAVNAQLRGNRRTGTVSGYFDNSAACLSELGKLVSAEGIYFTFNPVDPALLARRANRLDYARTDALTGNQHIVCRRSLVFDVDYKRPSGIGATDEQKEAAHKVALKIYDYLKKRGWPEPIVADSGNGYHLIYRIDLPSDDGGLIEKVLAALAACFDGDGVEIDRSVSNAARLIKLYGTRSCKGDDLKERPHRMSKLLRAPLLKKVTAEQLRALVDELLPKQPEKPKASVSSASRSPERDSKPSKEEIREMLAVIPNRPDYCDWIEVIAAVGDALNDTDAIEVLSEWSPEESPGEYAAKLKQRLRHIHVGTLIHLARQHGWTGEIPAPRARVDLWAPAESEPLELPPPPAPYVPPPLDLLPDDVQRFIRAGAATFDVDLAFFLLPLLSGAAAMIGNARSVRLKEDYIEPPIIWTTTVAPTGDGKSPGLQAATAPVRMRELELIRKNKEADKEYAAECARWNTKPKKDRGDDEKPPKPPILTCWMDDSTIEAVANRLNDNSRGVLLVKDEFSHWWESMDQYHDRSGSDVSRWLSIWTGNLFALDRVTDRRSYRIPDPRLSITGGAVPNKFKQLLTVDFFARGLPARFLPAMPTRNRPRKWIDKSIPREVKAEVNELFAKLAALEPHTNKHGEESPVLLVLSAEARKIFVDFFNECARRAHQADFREAAQWAKLSAYSARLALVGQLLWDPKAREVSANVMRAACDLARWFGNEAERIYALMAETPLQRQQRKLCEFIERHGRRVTVREVTQLFRPLKTNRDEAERQLNALVRAKYGEWIETKGARGPATREFQLLPLSTSTGFEISPSVEPEPVDVDSPSSQEITTSAAPEKEPSPATVSMPVTITKRMEALLRTLGYSQADIDKMTPGQANDIINSLGSVSDHQGVSEESGVPIAEPVSDGPEFHLLQETEAPPDPAVEGDLQI